MRAPSPSYVSEPQVLYLSQLLSEIGRGLLQVPRFQRPFVWRNDQRLELLRSIREGIPIGAILVWRSHFRDIACYTHLGPYRLTQPPEGGVRQYLLDGVQRLSTLYGALHSPDGVLDETEESEGGLFAVYFDLETQEFETSLSGSPSPHHLPLTSLLDSVKLLKFQRGLKGEEADTWIAASDDLARAFREYKVAVIPMVTDDLAMATKTFERINSQGEPMNQVHMVQALSWSGDFDLQKQLEQARQEWLRPLGWEELDDAVILNACKAALGLDIYGEKAIEKVSQKLREQPDLLVQTVRGLTQAAEFLRDHCHVPSPSLLPYAWQVVLLGDVFRQRTEPSAQALRLLHAWFWLTAEDESFDGIKGGRLRRALEDLHSMVGDERARWSFGDPFAWQPAPERLHLRTARTKVLVLRLGTLDPQDPVEGPQDMFRLLGDEGGRAFQQLLATKKGADRLYAGPANRFLVRPDHALLLRKALLEGDPSEELLRSHLISPDALQLLKQGDPEGFLTRRLADLNTWQMQFFRSVSQLFGEDGGDALRTRMLIAIDAGVTNQELAAESGLDSSVLSVFKNRGLVGKGKYANKEPHRAALDQALRRRGF